MESSMRARSRSLGKAKGNQTRIQFYHDADPSNLDAVYVCPDPGISHRGPRLLMSHGWIDGKLDGSSSSSEGNPDCPETWPLVCPCPPAFFVNRFGEPIAVSQRVPPCCIRAASSVPPLLSLVFVRWIGFGAVEADSHCSGWGKYGSPTSSRYLSALIYSGVMEHPKLRVSDGSHHDVDILSVCLRSSEDLWAMTSAANSSVAALRGTRKACFWMLWPTEWQDHKSLASDLNCKTAIANRTPPFYWKQSHDYAGFVDRHALFAAMRSFEGAGLSSSFPHSADLYELLTSKSWMASLCLQPQACLPAAVRVSKSSVLQDRKQAAKQALAALEHIRKLHPFPVSVDEPAAPSVVNKDGVTKGVVKLGFSWEAYYVLCFHNQQELEACLLEMMTYKSCTSSTCIVQEWVDFDFEMRWYFILPECTSGERLHPTRCECTLWSEWGSVAGPHSPTPESGVSMCNASQAKCLAIWDNDADAWEMAQKKASDISNHLLTWLLAMDSEPVPMIRLDFMVKRLSKGNARVVFGEFCEAGACCLSWEDGPPTTWHAALSHSLR